MAFGMKQWIGATVVGLALVAVWRLPPESPDPRGEQVRTAEAIRHQKLRAEVRLTEGILHRTMWADSLSALALAEAVGGVAVLSPDDGEGVADQRRRLAEQVRRQIDGRAPEAPRMLFGYVLQPHDHRRADGALSPRDRTETYVGTRDGVDYCLQVRVAPRRRLSDILAVRIAGSDDRGAVPRTDELGPCRFYVIYGLAGPRIQEWLEDGALKLAYEGGSEAPATELAGSRNGWRFWFASAFLRGGGDVGLNRCRTGLASACADFLERPGRYYLTDQHREVVRRSPATSIGSPSASGRVIHDEEYILADLEAEFGRDAFAEFWTSEQEVGVAFEAAFGVDAGSWLVTWLERTSGVHRTGPGLPRSATSGTMLALGLLLGVAHWRRRERRVVH